MNVTVRHLKNGVKIYYDFASNEMVTLNCGYFFRIPMRVIRTYSPISINLAVSVFVDITTYRPALPDIGVFTNG